MDAFSQDSFNCLRVPDVICTTKKALEGETLSIAQGKRVALVVDDATGFSTPLARLLRREGKRLGKPLILQEADITIAYPDLKPLTVERDAGLDRATVRAAEAVEAEIGVAILEALADGDEDEYRRLKQQRQQRREEQAEQRRADLGRRLNLVVLPSRMTIATATLSDASASIELSVLLAFLIRPRCEISFSHWQRQVCFCPAAVSSLL